MKNMKKYMLLLFFLIAAFSLTAFSVKAVDMIPIPKWGGGNITYRGTNVEIKMPAEYIEKESGFRAVWVTNVTNDISVYMDEAQYKAEMLRVFNTMEYYKMNAIIFHVRTHHDAMYKSSLNRLSSNYSRVDFEEFDPLEWIIEESRRRGIEVHAWMNPYRVGAGTIQSVSERFSAPNPAANPNNLLKGAQNVILNPGSPEVQSFLIDTVLELIRGYDVDAIHFDDYFYESGVDDNATFIQYGFPGETLANFRRRQVDTFIEELHDAMTIYNNLSGRRVQLGISPSGIYRNGSYVALSSYRYNADGSLQYPLGSNSAGFSHYDPYLYADTLKWINNEWIDYIVPQVYWSFDHTAAPFGDIVEWWNAALKNSNVNLYIGTALYTAGDASSNGWTHDRREFANQVQYASGLDNVHGQVIFSFSQLYNSLRPASAAYYQNMHNVKDEMWIRDTLRPEVRTLDPIYLPEVKNFNISRTNVGYRLDFDAITNAITYAIYRSTSPITFAPEELLKVVGKKEVDGKISYMDEVNTNTNYYYGVRALSRTNTPTSGISASTIGAPQGDLVPVGKLPEIIMSDIPFYNSNVTLKWPVITPNFGGDLTYNLYTSTDNVNFTRSTNQIVTAGNTVSTIISLDTSESVYYYLEFKNNVSKQNTKTYVINPTNDIGPIRGFSAEGDIYAGGEVTFKWPTVDKEAVDYKVEVSKDGIEWNLLPGEVIVTGGVGKFNYTLESNYSNNYYRVVGTNENGKAFSNELRITAYKQIPTELNLKLEGKKVTAPIYLEQSDSIELIWDHLTSSTGSVNYRAYISLDKVKWEVPSKFDSQNRIREYTNTSGLTINGNFAYFVIYVKVEAYTNEALRSSEIIEIRLIPSNPITKIVFNNYFYQYEASINGTGIYN